MKRAKNVAIVLVILAGLASSYLILRNPGSRAASGANSEISNLSDQILDKNPIQWVEKVKEQASAVMNNLNSGAQVKTVFSEQINFTDLVAQSMFGKVKEIGQAGGDPFSGDIFDPNSAANKNLLVQTISQLQGENTIFGQTVKDSDLKISPNNSKEAKVEYLKGIEKISNNHSGDTKYSSIEQAKQAINNDCFVGGSSSNKEIADNYKNTLNEYLGLTVPSTWLDFHKKIVSYFKNANMVFSYLSNCSSDPIGASLAAEFFPQLVEESESIQNLLAAKYKEAGLQ